MRFSTSGFFHDSTPYGHLIHTLEYFPFDFEFAVVLVLEAHPAQWTTAEDQISFTDTRDLTLGQHRPWIALLVYVYLLASLSL